MSHTTRAEHLRAQRMMGTPQTIQDDARGTLRFGYVNETRTFSWRPKANTTRRCETETCLTVLTDLQMVYCPSCASARTRKQNRQSRRRRGPVGPVTQNRRPRA